MLPFDVIEYKERVKKVKASMEEQGLEVLLITDPANMNYVSGYDALSYYVPQGVIISTNLEEPVCIVRLQDLYCATETTWMSQENVIPYPDKYLWEPKNLHVMDFISDFLKGKGLHNKKIGLEMDAYYFTAHWYHRLEKCLPDATFIDATSLVNWVRGQKSVRELEYMQIAARIVEKTMYNAIEKIMPGVRERDVAAGVYHDLVEGTGVYGGEYPSLSPIMPAGERTAGAHFSWTTEGKYQNNQLVYMELSGCYKRYHAPLTRTIYIGQPPERVLETTKIVVEGLNTALAAVKPGVTCEEVERAWQTTINKYGLEKESRMGYTVGLSYPPVWSEDTAYFKPGEKTVLKPNMTFHMMPGMWLDGYGVAITETIRVTETGCETITRFPRELFIK
ncbi:M24 family metallopeptidase [Neobacillus thermocopriae]|uniref:M24 family metallopeptidase n=1 Tax=Neobacillus thermocopriae TaxID=1215031 RepID=A0A6B3TP61_9BACI|nr:Xaa-Pro peptidase family protein [Neobacillus thermocopriae]MED3624079.1 Xaa-Pro peptidase family protein [Neobacillus thermocopriae]MED3713726.1 Xaa-Pro peptidase family protein [Neobacillus thermocopriae]NEX78129.1 M24 family metallopeptidase [Neobacillus thermocopriae]